ncbi:hypothetical protein Tco_0828888 [Tanacetum coccineum]
MIQPGLRLVYQGLMQPGLHEMPHYQILVSLSVRPSSTYREEDSLWLKGKVGSGSLITTGGSGPRGATWVHPQEHLHLRTHLPTEECSVALSSLTPYQL